MQDKTNSLEKFSQKLHQKITLIPHKPSLLSEPALRAASHAKELEDAYTLATIIQELHEPRSSQKPLFHWLFKTPVIFRASSHCCFFSLSSNGARPYESCDIAPGVNVV